MAIDLFAFEKISCYGQSQVEAQFIYKEIFEDGCYEIPNFAESPFVIDAGANIGLFSLYMKQNYPSSRVLAFEPAPDTFDILQRNLELHNAGNVEAFSSGLSSKEATAKLTYYPNLPGNSTLVPEEKRQLYDAAAKVYGKEAAEQLFGAVFATAREVDVKLQRLSHFLNGRSDLARIDLLKIDVEGAELDVLLGLDDAHWDLVQNVILEVCETSGTRTAIAELLKLKGFTVTQEVASWSPKDFFMIRASR